MADRPAIEGLKSYPAYKDSGLPWLGQVPSHWEIRPAFGAYMPNHERNRGMKEKTVLSLSYGRIVIKSADKLHGLVPESFETYQIVNPGDIVLRTTDLQNDHTSLRVGMVRDRGIITSAYLALQTRPGIVPEFGYQFLNVWDTSKAIYGYGSGLRQNLDFSHFKRMPVAIPSSDEQAAIVRFLDRANGRLERAIRAKRKVIALLNEQKQAIIQHAVTRGLDPSVPLKPSGIPWLGDIPQHWEAVRFKTRVGFREGPGIMLSDFRETGIPLLRISCLSGTEATLKGCNYLSPAKVREKWAHFAVKAGDYLLSASGSTGGVCRASEEVVGSIPYTGIIRLWPKSDAIDMRYLKLFMSAQPFAEQITMAKSGVGIEHFGPTHLKRMWILQPPVEEQHAIVKNVTNATAGLEVSLSRLKREIELLREYRTRLVADVVTGKLDVREAAARLPDEAPLDSIDLDADSGDEMEGADAEAVA